MIDAIIGVVKTLVGVVVKGLGFIPFNQDVVFIVVSLVGAYFIVRNPRVMPWMLVGVVGFLILCVLKLVGGVANG